MIKSILKTLYIAWSVAKIYYLMPPGYWCCKTKLNNNLSFNNDESISKLAHQLKVRPKHYHYHYNNDDEDI